jgi:hypothetical protein
MSDEVTSSDIARLAGVRRTAVSNWRRRHADFPQPVGGPPSSPTFALPEIEAWLQANGRQTAEESFVDDSADLPTVVASLLPAGRPDVVLDPMCGNGRMLVAAARRFGPSVTYVGQDQDRSRVDSAARALADAGARGSGLAVGWPLSNDVLARYRRGASAVVCQPPMRSSWLPPETNVQTWEFAPPGQTDQYQAWLQICYGYVRPGGTAVLPLPVAAAVRPSGRRVRAELLRTGALRQVIALPEDLAPYPQAHWQIWVLERPADRPLYTVRLVDLSESDVPVTADEWESVYADRALTHDVPAIELLDEDVLLLPSRHVEAPVRPVGPEYGKLRTDLAKATARLDVKLPSYKRDSGPLPYPMTSVMDLVRSGAISLLDKGMPEAGDVLVRSRSDALEASVIGEPVPESVSGDVLRCDPTAIDPYFLACFIQSENNRRHATGTLRYSSRLDLRRLRVPHMPLADQQRYGDAYRRLTDLASEVDRLGTLVAEAVRTAVDGLTSGTLRP